jgi:hypothetical protein
MNTFTNLRAANRIAAFSFIVGVFLIWELAHSQEKASKFSIIKVGYKINSGEMQWAQPDTIIDFSPGDKISLVSLEFKSPSSSGSTWAEAYYHDGAIPGEAGVNYKDGQFTYGKKLSSGKNTLSFKRGAWTLQSTYDRFIVVLIHQYGAGDRDFRKVDTVNINLRVKEEKK